MIATPEELNKWLGRESGEPVHVATTQDDLAAELKRGLAYVRSEKYQDPRATNEERTRRVLQSRPTLRKFLFET